MSRRSRPQQVRRIAFACILLPLTGLMAGCGAPSAPSGQGLAPGSMELISVTPISAAAGANSENLLRNGDFREFWAGSPAPTGFSVPGADGASQVRRGVALKNRGISNFSAIQTWNQADSSLGLSHRLTTQTPGLKPATAYRVEITADGDAGLLAGIGVFQVDENGNATDSAPRVLTAAGGIGAKNYVGHFLTQSGGGHVLASALLAAEKLPATMTWYEWRLSEVPGDMAKADIETRLADQDKRARQIDWQLRQFKEMATSLGGFDAWAAKTAPLIANLQDTLKLVGDAGTDIFEGEDGYLFSRTESLFLLEKELVYDQEGRFTPLASAVVDFSRQLANQGIDLLFVPVPARGFLFPDKLAPGTDPSLHPAPQVVRFMQALNSLDVEAVDLLESIRGARQRNESVCFRTDGRLSNVAIARMAKMIVPRLERYGFFESGNTPRTEFNAANKPVKWRGGMLAGLSEDRRSAFADEAQAVTQITDEQGTPFQPPEKSPIAVMGAMASDYAEEGASFVAHVSKELRYPVALLPVRDPGPGAPRKLADLGPNALEGVRVLVWLVAIDSMRTGGDSTWESMPEY